jgi:NACalpha-BTF3-like transcription factor
MAESKTEEGLRERTLVDITSADDVKYWTEQFGVDADELRAAVKFVGKDVALVEAHLKKGKVKV